MSAVSHITQQTNLVRRHHFIAALSSITVCGTEGVREPRAETGSHITQISHVIISRVM